MSDDKCKRTEWSSIYNGCMPVASTYRVQGRSGAKSSQRLCTDTFETFWNAWNLFSHRCVSEVSRDSCVARVLQLGGSPESAQNRWRWCVAASWNAWYAPKALRQARLVRLRSRKCWLQLSWTRTRKLRHWGRYATEVDIAVVPCFSFNLLSHRLTSKDAQGS